MNVIDYAPYIFDDSALVSGSVAMENSLMFDSLKPDELTVEVISNDTGKRKLLTVDRDWYTTVDDRGYVVMTSDIRQFTYGDPVLYYYDDVLQGKYYIRSVDRLSVDHFKLSAFSAVGMWTSIQHFGGIYDGDTTGDVIADLLTGFSYTIDPDVAAVPLYGYLPIASVRDNLQQVLFAIGASLMKNSSGNPHFKFLQGVPTIPVSDERIFIGGKLNYKTPATSIRVTEHSYYISSYDVEVSLFDNTDGSGTADNKLVTFDEPCHDLVATGLTLGANGANYAYVTGTGTLTGKKYTHTQKIFSVPTGASGEPSEAKIEKATLVSPVNSANVAARVSDYKGTAEEVACGIVMDTDDIKPASLITFTDPYGDATQGFVATMNITMSGKSKADCTIVKNYTPAHFGNNFTTCTVYTSNGTYTATKDGVIRIVLIQGGTGGTGGSGGGRGWIWGGEPDNAEGVGGSGGDGGSAGKVFVTDLDVSVGDTFTMVIGTGGAGGSGGIHADNNADRSGGSGAEGTHSTMTRNGAVYTSENGARPANGYNNILTGITYAENGADGIDGANGGQHGKVGESVTYNGTTWTGGAGYGSTGYQGAGGGGAAYGANGSDAYYNSTANYGGRGATAAFLSVVATRGSGGNGGNGGGGGGIGGTGGSSGTVDWGHSAYGGDGSDGCDGGDGLIIVFE